MIVIPAIDLRRGSVVRLVEGDPARATFYGDDPVSEARRFAEAGTEWLHVVDLDAALGEGSNLEAVEAICREVRVPVQAGGGVRSMDAVERWLAAGVARVVLGTGAVTDPGFVRDAIRRWGGQIVVAVDVRPDPDAGYRVMVRGWRDAGPVLGDLLDQLEGAGTPRYLATGIAADGTLRGPDLELYRHLVARLAAPVIASGGVRDLDDLDALASVGVEAVVVGRALYEGTLALENVGSTRWR